MRLTVLKGETACREKRPTNKNDASVPCSLRFMLLHYIQFNKLVGGCTRGLSVIYL